MALSQSDFTATFSQMFADIFLLRYQARQRLRGVVREIHGLVGDAYKLKYMDKIQMQQHGAFNANIPSTPVTTTAPTISFSDWELKTSIDEFEQLNFNADALRGFAMDHADAIGRREDQFIIDALDTGATKTVAAGGDDMTIDKIKDAQKQLAEDEVDGDELFLIMHANNYNSLLGQIEFVNNLYTDVKPFASSQPLVGFKGKFLDFNLIVLGDRAEGGLQIAANIRDTYAFAKNSTTLGYRKDPETRMIPVEQEARTETLSLLSAGAVVGDARGVVKIFCDES